MPRRSRIHADAARSATPTLTEWALTESLAAHLISSSDTAALGGDLAYRFGRFGTLSDVGATSAAQLLDNTQFGVQATALVGIAGLHEGMLLS